MEAAAANDLKWVFLDSDLDMHSCHLCLCPDLFGSFFGWLCVLPQTSVAVAVVI